MSATWMCLSVPSGKLCDRCDPRQKETEPKRTAIHPPFLDTPPKKRQSPPLVCRCPFGCSAERIKREDGEPLNTVSWWPFRRCPRNGRRRYESLQPLCFCMGRRLVTGNHWLPFASPETGPQL